MASIIFGNYEPIERVELDFSDPDIIDVEWFDEQGSPIGTKIINGVEFSDTIYGEKVKVKVKFQNYSDNRRVFISISTNNKNCHSYKPSIPMLQVKGNEALSEAFYLPITLYCDEIEEYDYGKHYTKVAAPQELYVTVSARTTLKSKPNQILKPYSYFRNYEELVGLFKTDNSGSKHFKDNYENQFIEYNSSIKTIVNNFITEITDIQKTLTEAEIEAQVRISAKTLWDAAVKQHQYPSMYIAPDAKIHGLENIYDSKRLLDDRPLYWARNKMQVYLKRHPAFKGQLDIEKSTIEKGSRLEHIIKIFEELSRNYTGIDFSNANGKKKVLVTGFDPFQMNPDQNFNTSMGTDSAKTFNPSGIVALFLSKNKELLNQKIDVQTCIFPVRYEDFDKGYVEDVIRKYIADVDMIITTSLNGSHNWFDIEADAIEYRGGFHDNMCIGGQNYSQYNYNSSRFIANTSSKHNLTTLPKSKIFGNNSSIIINNLLVKYDTSELNSATNGGGGNYLSNEIMFRATSVRGVTSTKPVGHFHLANLGDITRIKEVIYVTKEIITKIIN